MYHNVYKNVLRRSFALMLCLLLSACGAKLDELNKALFPSDQNNFEMEETPTEEPIEESKESEASEENNSSENTKEEVKPPPPTVAKLAVCGDIMSHMPINSDAWNEEENRFDYRHIFREAKPIISAADYAIGNLETVFAGGPPYSGFPRFNSPDTLADDLIDTGFDFLLTANNHCMDQGYSGLCRTLNVLDERGLKHVGTQREEEEGNIVVANANGISIAFLGYTYGTNGIPLPSNAPWAVNLFTTDYLTSTSTLDKERVAADLERAKTFDTDLIIVLIHWGIEYHTEQNAFQTETANFLFDNGADIVIGGHSHVLQPMRMRPIERNGIEKNGFICYSLGNFISSQNSPLTDTTAILELELTRDNESGITQVTDYQYTPMLMLDRERGAAERFSLLDASKEREDCEPWIKEKLVKAAKDCMNILGAEHMVKNALLEAENVV